MKTNSTSRSAFLIPRAVLGFALCSAGVFLAVAALTKSVAETPARKAAITQPGTWTATSSMSIARDYCTATLLTNGKVLVAGGSNSAGSTSSAELYDPATGLWTPTGNMTVPRAGHTATLLPDGRVLVAGGSIGAGCSCSGLASAELYDPITGTWTLTGSMNTSRAAYQAILITSGPLSGMVLVTGGSSTCGGCTPILDTAELYDPSTGMWTYTGNMSLARTFGPPTPTELPNGSILIVGGTTCCPYHDFNEAELYDQVNQTWTPTSNKTTWANADGELLQDGKVLVAGGSKGTQPNSVVIADAELFDSSMGVWTATASMSTARNSHTLTVLPSGQVLAAGGNNGHFGECFDVTSAELYDSSAGTWFPTGNMTAARSHFRATLLPNGQVLAVGGGDCEGNVLFSAELYTPPTGTVNPVPLINQPLVPDTAAPGGAAFTMTVNGTGFVSGSVVNWNGSARATIFVNGSQLTAAILASDIATASTASVTVVNPAPGGGTSNEIFFPITVSTSSVSLSRSEFATSVGPESLATGDFQRNGKLCLAVTNQNASTVSILIGNGDGTFQPHVDYATGDLPVSVTVADFNGDNVLDLALRNQGSDTISVLLGNGDGTFQSASNFATGPGFGRLSLGDFNGDGKLDLVTTNFGGDTVSILLGNGNGTFLEHVDYATGSVPLPLAVGDLNGDNKLDLVVGNIGSNRDTFSILLGNGDGTFRASVEYPSIRDPQSLVLADFNGDGELDLAIFSQVNEGETGLLILLGNGDGTFRRFADYATGCGPDGSDCSAAVADLNGDGRLDLAAHNSSNNTVSVLLGNGDGTFQSAVAFATGEFPNQVISGDFNADGRLDLAVADANANTVSVLLQATTVALSDTSLKFGLQLVGTASTARTVTLTNSGPITLTISSIAVSEDFVQRNDCGSRVPAGESCTIKVAFKPSAKGVRTGTVTITDDAANSPQVIALAGTGTVVELSPTSLNFDDQRVGTISPPQTVRLTNTGSTPLSIRGIGIVGNNFGDFVETTTCGSSVPANSSCAIDVRFRPTATGLRTASVKVQHDGGGAQPIGLRGRGVSSE